MPECRVCGFAVDEGFTCCGSECLKRERIQEIVRTRIRLTADYPTLRDAALRFVASIHGKQSGEYAKSEREFLTEPERLLREHSYVMHAKSQRAKTLRWLSAQVATQAELPMMPIGKFRGDDSHVDWDKAADKWLRD